MNMNKKTHIFCGMHPLKEFDDETKHNQHKLKLQAIEI